MIEHVPSWWPIAGYALGFVMGATAGPRFAFYSKCWSKCWRRRPYSSAVIAFCATAEDAAKVRSKIINPLVWEDPPEPFDDLPSIAQPRTGKTYRWFINNPVQIAECGGPCTQGPSHCDCGALWVDVPAPSRGAP